MENNVVYLLGKVCELYGVDPSPNVAEVVKVLVEKGGATCEEIERFMPSLFSKI